jgi:uncharacterized C2H2 Zn-finger protein
LQRLHECDFRCPHCPKKIFKSESTLRNHLNSKHSPSKSRQISKSVASTASNPVLFDPGKFSRDFIAKTSQLSDDRAVVMLWNQARKLWSNAISSNVPEQMDQYIPSTMSLLAACIDRVNRVRDSVDNYTGTLVYCHIALARLFVFQGNLSGCLDSYEKAFYYAKLPWILPDHNEVSFEYDDIKPEIHRYICRLRQGPVSNNQQSLIRECGIIGSQGERPSRAGFLSLLVAYQLGDPDAKSLMTFIKNVWTRLKLEHCIFDIYLEQSSMDDVDYYEILWLAIELRDLIRMQRALRYRPEGTRVLHLDLYLLQRLCRALIERDYIYLRSGLLLHCESLSSESQQEHLLQPLKLKQIQRFALQFAI